MAGEEEQGVILGLGNTHTSAAGGGFIPTGAVRPGSRNGLVLRESGVLLRERGLSGQLGTTPRLWAVHPGLLLNGSQG